MGMVASGLLGLRIEGNLNGEVLMDSFDARLALSITLIVCFVNYLQWLAIVAQVFVKKETRAKRSFSLALCQFVLITVFSALVFVIDIICIIYFRFYTRYYFLVLWLFVDAITKLTGPVFYYGQLQNVRYEQLSTYMSFEKHNTEDEVQKDSRVEKGGFRRRLIVSEDYYALSFCTNIEYYAEKYQITENQRVNFLINVCIIFSM